MDRARLRGCRSSLRRAWCAATRLLRQVAVGEAQVLGRGTCTAPTGRRRRARAAPAGTNCLRLPHRRRCGGRGGPGAGRRLLQQMGADQRWGSAGGLPAYVERENARVELRPPLKSAAAGANSPVRLVRVTRASLAGQTRRGAGDTRRAAPWRLLIPRSARPGSSCSATSSIWPHRGVTKRGPRDVRTGERR
jgi:hypothetical protein